MHGDLFSAAEAGTPDAVEDIKQIMKSFTVQVNGKNSVSCVCFVVRGAVVD